MQYLAGAGCGGTDDLSYIACAYSDGNHRVPNVNRNSDGDWKFNLGYFENDWNDDNCLLCFCYSFFSPINLFIGGSFFLQVFLPSAEHTPDLVEIEYQFTVGCMVKHFFFPSNLKEEFQKIVLTQSLRNDGELLKFVVGKRCSEDEFK